MMFDVSDLTAPVVLDPYVSSNPYVDHNWILPPGYSWHMETTSWAVTPRDPNDLETLG